MVVLNKKLLVSLCCLALALPLGASVVQFNGGTYYVGLEDQFPKGDYDYNDLIFTLTGNQQVTLNASGTAPTLFAPIVPNNITPPFWDNSSQDQINLNPANPNYNFGECLYVSGNGCTGTPLAPQADYLASSTGGAVDFRFSAPAGTIITLNLLAQVNGSGTLDQDSLYICSPDPAVTTCMNISPIGGTYTVGASGTFNLGFYDGTNVYDSDTKVTGLGLPLSDPTIDHFAVALTPEPGTLAVVGSVLVGLGMLRRQRNKKR